MGYLSMNVSMKFNDDAGNGWHVVTVNIISLKAVI